MARSGKPIRRWRFVLTLGCLGLLPAAADVGGARADPRADVGAKVAMKTALTGLRPGDTIAVLFLQGKDQTNQAVCKEYFSRYDDSFKHPGDYDRFVYFIKNPAYVSPTIDCTSFRQSYNRNVWSLASNDLGLDRLGDGAGPLLVVVKGVAGGHYVNMGYVNFYGAKTDQAISAKFDKFGAYFLCRGRWAANKEVDQKPNPILSLLPNFGPSC
jgi:hypothetical protein